MNEYIECQGCAFVLQTGATPPQEPKHWDACPDCHGTTFDALTGDSIGPINPSVVDAP